jgi:hypothetical protein
VLPFLLLRVTFRNGARSRMIIAGLSQTIAQSGNILERADVPLLSH